MSLISVVIPCYNQGAYIHDAIQSVENQTFRDFEIIIVNDGSSDSETISILSNLQKPCVRIIHTDNQGVSIARNIGIKSATGTYILPLDADDRIGNDYLRKAFDVIEQCPDIGFVYCLAELFGARRGKFYLNKATITEMLFDSRVFCTALFRKADWEAVDGYNPNMVYGWEDWDFWLSLLELGRQPYMIEEVMFFYRVKKQSRTRSMTFEHRVTMHRQLYENHRELYKGHTDIDFERYQKYKDSIGGKILELMRKVAFNIKYFGK